MTTGPRPAVPTAELLAALQHGPETVLLIEPDTGAIRWVSERMRELAGWEPDQLLGMLIQDLDTSIPPGPEMWAQIVGAIAPGRVMVFMGQVRRADGSRSPVEVRLTLLDHDGHRTLVAAVRDVTGRVLVEDRLREREAMLASIIAALGDGLLVIDNDAIVTLANPRAAELAGIPLHQIVDRPVTALLDRRHDEDGNAVPADETPLLRTLATGKPFSGVVHGIEGEVPRWVLVNTSPIIEDETGEIRGAVATHADITDLIRARAELEELAGHDVLTALPNRGRFQQVLEALVHAGTTSEHHLALLFLDLDGFKTVNDSLGHSRGDELLRVAGNRLRHHLRPDDFIARIGGDEFVVLLPELGPDLEAAKTEAADVARRIVGNLSDPFRLSSQTVRISASVGIAVCASSEADAEQLLRQADLAMYAAKEAGRGGFRHFDQSMDAQAHRTMQIDGNLRRAVEHQEFELHLQPRIALATGELSGAEALLRWPGNRFDPLDTTTVIATAERNGLILPLGRWVLNEAKRLAVRLRDEGVLQPGMTLSVNISGHQLQHADFVGELAAIVDEADLWPGALTVELTESSLVSDLAEARSCLKQIERLGVPVAIDDFGTGYSSLAYLRDLPVQELKLDRTFVAELGEDPVSEIIVDGIIAIAQQLGIDTVAEGVEREAQRSFLARSGCTHFQGYLASAAVPVDEFVARYRP